MGLDDSIRDMRAVWPIIIFFLVIIMATIAAATEDYALETGQKCAVCHVSESGGGGLTTDGEAYSKDPENWKAPTVSRLVTPLYLKIVHTFILYAHILFGIVWVGTILYVHLVLKPKYALGGLPRSELRLAWLSMPIIAVTGILLTVWRLRLSSRLFYTVFGKLLLIKIAIFTLMFFSATFVTFFIGPRLRKLVESRSFAEHNADDPNYTLEELKAYDGEHQEKVLIAANGSVYDVTESRMWRGGVHAQRHKAGDDLTEFIQQAPHDSSVLERVRRVGVLSSGPEVVPLVVRVFTVNAYFNLAGCFLIILVLVLWRW
ncbi:MAG: cytochrome b5 domain-containing protein [bacterium]